MEAWKALTGLSLLPATQIRRSSFPGVENASE
jgi:hypothetical protein